MPKFPLDTRDKLTHIKVKGSTFSSLTVFKMLVIYNSTLQLQLAFYFSTRSISGGYMQSNAFGPSTNTVYFAILCTSDVLQLHINYCVIPITPYLPLVRFTVHKGIDNIQNGIRVPQGLRPQVTFFSTLHLHTF